MTPFEYLQHVVQPNISECGRNASSIRHALNAVHSVDALAAHIYSWCVQHAPAEVQGISDDTQFRRELAKRAAMMHPDQTMGLAEDWLLLRDVAKAAKHVRLTRETGTPSRVKSIQGMGARHAAWGKAVWGESLWAGAGVPHRVLIEVDGGAIERDVEAVLRNAAGFLMDEMKRLGLWDGSTYSA